MQVSPKHVFCKYLGLHRRNPRGFLILTSFRGCTSHFRFDHFYIVDFHSSLSLQVTFRKSEGRVKIYNVKMIKTEMACAPPNTCQNQKFFQIPSNQPPNTCRAGWAISFFKDVFSWNTLMYLPISLSWMFFWDALCFGCWLGPISREGGVTLCLDYTAGHRPAREAQDQARVGKCQIFYMDQYRQTSFYPEKSA